MNEVTKPPKDTIWVIKKGNLKNPLSKTDNANVMIENIRKIAENKKPSLVE